MSEFKVGDKVSQKIFPYVELNNIDSNVFKYCLVDISNEVNEITKKDDATLNEEIPDMSYDEIYDMLKPMLKKALIYIDRGYYYELNSDAAIALAYRSGYLRAKKGRPFKIGGEKE